MEQLEKNPIKQLGGYALLILVVAVVVLIGWAILNGFDTTLRQNTAVNPVQITLGITGVPVLIGTAGQYPYVQTLTSCINASNGAVIGETNYTYSTNHPSDYITLLAAGHKYNNSLVNCSLTYLKDTEASTATGYFKAALITFGTFIGILAIALLGKTIIGLFRQGL